MPSEEEDPSANTDETQDDNEKVACFSILFTYVVVYCP